MERRRLVLVGIIAVGVLVVPTLGAELGPIFFGIHMIPAVEAGEAGRTWDVSLSLGVGAEFDGSNRVEIHALTDSHLTSFGATVLYRGRLTERLDAGGGVTVLWPFDEEQRLLRPLVEAFAHASVEPSIGTVVSGDLSVSFPVVTFVRRLDGWDLIPLAELPSLSLAATFDVAVNGAFQAQLTLQPVIADTTLLSRPIGRVTDDLLILPSLSGFALYAPPS